MVVPFCYFLWTRRSICFSHRQRPPTVWKKKDYLSKVNDWSRSCQRIIYHSRVVRFNRKSWRIFFGPPNPRGGGGESWRSFPAKKRDVVARFTDINARSLDNVRICNKLRRSMKLPKLRKPENFHGSFAIRVVWGFNEVLDRSNSNLGLTIPWKPNPTAARLLLASKINNSRKTNKTSGSERRRIFMAG